MSARVQNSPTRRTRADKNKLNPSLERFLIDTVGFNPPLLHFQKPVPAQTVPVSRLNWSPAVAKGFEYRDAYSHQVSAFEALERGQNLILTTPTASGKTGAFFPALFAALELDPHATALLVYPLVALAQDQRGKLLEFNRLGGFDFPIAAFEGGVEARATFTQNPRIITTTPDKLHWSLGLSALHPFLEHLKIVVLDEAHTYRGGFGSEVSGLLRRLFALCSSLRGGGLRGGGLQSGGLSAQNEGPRVVLSTATLGEPLEFARSLTGLDNFAEVSHSGAPTHGKSFYLASHGGQPRRFWDALVRSSLENNLKTLVFLRGRTKAVRLHADYRSSSFEKYVHLYLSGAGGRAERLETFRNAPSGVMFATSALEAGVDIGDLDTVLLDGYPGNRMTFRQMVGRCGRRGDGLVLLLPATDADGDALPSDAFYSTPENFSELLTGTLERLPLEPHNPFIAPRHAALLVAEHRRSGLVLPETTALFGYPPSSDSQRWSLRGDGSGKFYTLERRTFEREGTAAFKCALDSPSEHYARLEKHLRARTLLEGETFEVGEWRKVGQDTALLLDKVEFDPAEFTRGFARVVVKPLEMTPWKVSGELATRVGRGEVTRAYPGYGIFRRKSVRACRDCDLEPELGVMSYRCAACGGALEDKLRTQTVSKHYFDAVHISAPFETGVLELGINAGPKVVATLEQTLLKLIPLAVVCDPADLGVAARADHENYLFFFENFRGGLGIMPLVHAALPVLFKKALELCRKPCCVKGCYECVARSSRGEGLDKSGAAGVLEGWVSDGF